MFKLNQLNVMLNWLIQTLVELISHHIIYNEHNVFCYLIQNLYVVTRFFHMRNVVVYGSDACGQIGCWIFVSGILLGSLVRFDFFHLHSNCAPGLY